MDLNKLKQDAEEKAKKRTKGFKCQDNCEKSYVMGALDFAEPREKRIEELEDTIANLKEQVQSQVEATIELDKENAELKAKNKWYSEQVCNKECAEVWGNLTKAKEHIQTLISCLIDWVQEGDKDYCYIADAEQFLKDIKE